MNDETINYGVCWYQPEQWDRLKEISEDREELEDTYNEWRRNASKAIAELGAQGQKIKKVKIDLEALLYWCNGQDRPVNGKSRSEYVAYLMKTKTS